MGRMGPLFGVDVASGGVTVFPFLPFPFAFLSRALADLGCRAGAVEGAEAAAAAGARTGSSA